MAVDARRAATRDPGSRAARTIAALTSAEVVGKVATLAMFMVLTRALGLADFGTFSYGLGLGLLLAAIPSLGLDTTVVQRGSQDPAAVPRLLAELLTLRIVLGAAVVLGAAAVLGWTTGYGAGTEAVLLLIVAGVLETFIHAQRAVCGARQQQTRTAGVLVVQRLVTLALVVAAVAAGTGLVGAAVAYLAGTAVGVVGMGWAARRAQAAPRWRAVRWAGIRSLAGTARVVGVDDVVATALARIDVVILQAVAGPAAVGVYTAAYRLLETVLFVTWAISRTLMPMMAASDRPRLRDLSRLSVELAAVVYLPYAVVLFLHGDALVALIFGGQYAHTGVVQWLALAPLLIGAAGVLSATLLSQRPDPAVLWSSVAALVVNVALNLALVPVWGAAGAAAATTLAHLVEAGALALVVTRVVGGPVDARAWGVLLVATTGATLVLLVPLPALAAVGLAAVLYLALWLGLTGWRSPDRLHFLRQALLPAGRPA